MKSLFSYNAYAVGLGGEITSAGEVIPSAGSIVLASSGGSGESQLDNYSSPLGSITASKIVTNVSGRRFGENQFVAEATVVITNLKVRDIRKNIEVFTADFLSAHVFSSHTKNGKVDPDSSITFHAKINGLRANGEEIDASIDTTLLDKNGDTYEGFLNAFTNNADALEYADHFGWDRAECLDGTRHVVPARFREISTIPVSLMSRKAAKSVNLQRNKFTVTIPGLAELHIGEAILKRGRRRLNLLRLELGSKPESDSTVGENDASGDPPAGSLSFACVEGNGTEIMP